jgi:hypothetical protein
MHLKTIVESRSGGTVLPLLDSHRSTRIAAQTELVNL